jgi:hypothetical protein
MIAAPVDERTSIFVLGHPKSGTTVVARSLEAVSGASLTDDLFHRLGVSRATRERLFRDPGALRQFIQTHPEGFATRINKTPKLTFLYAPLRQAFPTAQYVFVVRDPRSALRSFLGWRNIPGNLKDALPEHQERLATMPAPAAGQYIEQLAARWNLAADTYLDHRGDFLLVRYEDFLTDPVATVVSLARALGLPSDGNCSGPIRHSYKASGVGGVPWLDFFGSDNLHRIERLCRVRMSAFGYA